MATETDLEFYRGEAARLEFTIDPVEDITGWTLRFTLARQKNARTKILELPCTISSGVDGEFYVEISTDQMDLTPGRYFWDVWTISTGSEKPLGIGEFQILPDVYMPQ